MNSAFRFSFFVLVPLGTAVGCATYQTGVDPTGTGGSASGGHHSTSGGASTGGAKTGSGGSQSGTGGILVASGGQPATGGSASGGAASGGATSGGAAASGGAASGGAASGGSSSAGGASSGGGGGILTGNCAGVPTYEEWKAGSGQATLDQIVHQCSVIQAGCSGLLKGVDYLWECTQSHVPNCESQMPEHGTSWALVGECVPDMGTAGAAGALGI